MISIVAGFGRCGSSMMMQMLQAGGMPCAGEWPAFEPQEANILAGQTISVDWLRSIPGHAIKVLDPQRGHIPVGDYRVIWMSRDYVEQAKSAMKLMRLMGFPDTGRTMRRELVQSYVKDRTPAFRVIAEAGVSPVLQVRFEDVLADPMREATKVAEFLGAGLDATRMAAAVRNRGPECYPGFMEFDILQPTFRADPHCGTRICLDGTR